ncbi:hypothetical protein BvCmsK139A_04818 [Escherichia coli]|nr:hypothetical protein BvCmsK139A_04818 [Escherichia coli]
MSAGRVPVRHLSYLRIPKSRMTWFIQYPAPSSKFQVRQTIAPLLRTTRRNCSPFLDKDVPVLYGNGFGLFAGKGAVRQPLKYSEIFAHPHLSGDAPYRTGRGRCHIQSFRTGYRLKTRNRHPPAVAAEAPAARPYVHGLSFLRHLFSYRPPPVVPAEADR